MRYKIDQRGFTHLGLILLVLAVIVAIGFGAYRVGVGNNVPTGSDASKEAAEEKQPSDDPYSNWKGGSFKHTELSYKLPPNWQNISEDLFQDSEFVYEEVKIQAPDGFVLAMSVNDLPRGYEGFPENTVLEFKNIDGQYQWIIADNANGKVSKIYLGSGIKTVGERIVPVARVSRGEVGVEVIGLYEQELDSLTEFNSKQSVQEAKLVLESLKFN